MKIKLFIFSFLLCFSNLLQAQIQQVPDPTYISTNGWVFRNTALMPNGNTQANAVSPTLVVNPGSATTNVTPDGSIGIAQGQLHFNNIENGSNNYVSAEYNMMGALTNNWVVEFEFTPMQVGEGTATGAFVFSLTDGPGNRFRAGTDTNAGNGKVGVPGQMISVTFGNTIGQTDYYIKPFAKWTDDDQPTQPNDIYWGAVPGNNAQINLDGANTLETTYRIRLERLNTVDYRLTVWRLNETEPIGERCFFLNHNLTNLSYIQHSNVTAASGLRFLTGTLDNLTINDNTLLDDCCIPTQILGPTTACESATPVTYEVAGGGADLTYVWSFPSGRPNRWTDNGHFITIDDWSNWAGTNGNLIQVDIFCGCSDEPIATLSIAVNVLVELDADFLFDFTDNNNGTFFPDMQSIATTIGQHTWQIFESPDNSNDNCDVIGSELDNATGTSPVFTTPLNYVHPTNGTINYVAIHTVSHAGGLCPSVHCEKFSNTGRPSGGSIEKTVSPNPSTGLINIDYQGENYENVQIRVIDILGRKILQQNITNQDTQISIKEKGIFIVEIWNGETLESTERVLIE